MRKIDLIIVHCSATPEGKDFTTADINRWHRQREQPLRRHHRRGHAFAPGCGKKIRSWGQAVSLTPTFIVVHKLFSR